MCQLGAGSTRRTTVSTGPRHNSIWATAAAAAAELLVVYKATSDTPIIDLDDAVAAKAIYPDIDVVKVSRGCVCSASSADVVVSGIANSKPISFLP